jgi:type II secretory pathway pseudopilin PulG
LLVVVAIIGILVAILFPVLGLMRSRADSAQCLHQLGQIGSGMAAYMNDHDGTFPGPLTCTQSATYSATTQGSLAALLENYLGTPNSPPTAGASRFSPHLECPSARRLLNNTTTATYLMNMLPSPVAGQSVWGDVTLGEKPMAKAALVEWGDDVNMDPTHTSGNPLSLSEMWAMQDADQSYVTSHTNFFHADVTGLLPNSAHVDHYNALFFDSHAESRVAGLQVLVPATPAPSTPAPSSGSP